jgi:proline iminopeptidase
LVDDVEMLRRHLKIEKWHLVFGGSWGSTLSLAYAQTHPGSVGSLVLRGIFAVRQLELQWSFTRGGASIMRPEAFEQFIDFLPEQERDQTLKSYLARLLSDDPEISLPAALAWNRWELSVNTLRPYPDAFKQLDDPTYVLAHARIEAHYFDNAGWLDDGQLFKKENIDKIRHIPSKQPCGYPQP